MDSVSETYRGPCHHCDRTIVVSEVSSPTSPTQCECGWLYWFAVTGDDEGELTSVPGKIAPALCLDFDGTIRYSTTGAFINRPEDVRLYRDVEAKLWEYRRNNYLICGVTNQGSVAFGYRTVRSIQRDIDATLKLFDRNPFHLVKMSFHHPDGTIHPYNMRSLMRKPDIGMLAEIERDAYELGYVVDWDQSMMVGDRAEDEQLAINARITFVWADVFFGRSQPE